VLRAALIMARSPHRFQPSLQLRPPVAASVTIPLVVPLTELESAMALGPIEVLVVSFPGNKFSGGILPELQRLVDNDTITIIDGLLVRKDDDGSITFTEFEEVGGDPDAEALAEVMDQLESLISDEDVEELASALAPGSSEAILVFEHTWAKPLRNAIVDSGGILANNFRVPGLVVEELLAELAELDA
jgi:hypothetical protein